MPHMSSETLGMRAQICICVCNMLSFTVSNGREVFMIKSPSCGLDFPKEIRTTSWAELCNASLEIQKRRCEALCHEKQTHHIEIRNRSWKYDE